LTNLSVSILESIHDADKNQWNNLINQSNVGSIFQKYEWLNVLEKGLQLKPKHILISKDNNPLGIFPHFIINEQKEPFQKLCSVSPGFGGPVIGKGEDAILPLMFQQIPKICKGKIALHTMILNNLNYVKYGKFLFKSGYQMSLDGLRFYINLKNSYDELLSNMDHHKRKEFKKIKKTLYSVIEQKNSIDFISNFYKDYTDSLEKNNVSSYPFIFFETLLKEMKDNVKIFTAIVDDVAIGSVLCILDNEKNVIHGFFSAIPSKYLHLKPWIMLHDFIVQWGKDKSFQFYDLGETPADFLDSIFKYKQGFGGSIHPIMLWEKNYSFIRWNIFKSGRYIYRKLS
jgi:predicted N-acyltransferase